MANVYDRRVQSALYFPYINVPETPWLYRTMLYWDRVGTIAPDEFRARPEFMDPHTRRLVSEGLLVHVVPSDIGGRRRNGFHRFLDGLSEMELRRRRSLLALGLVSAIHMDKLVYDDLRQLTDLRLARPRAGDDRWLEVESATANEFMAALALALCHPENDLVRPAGHRGTENSWVPVTDLPEAMAAMLSGLSPATPGPTNRKDREHESRMRGEQRVSDIRTSVLDRLLPVPAEPMGIADLLRFRARHGELLPQLRLNLEAQFDEALQVDDEDIRQRRIDRIVEEADHVAAEAQRYMAEAGFRRIERSSFLRLLKFVPLLSGPVDALQGWAAAHQTVGDFESKPLAYIGFARTELRLVTRFEIDPWTGVPLVTAMTDAR